MKRSVFNLQQQNKKVEERIVASLERISEAFRVLLWEQSKETGLSPIQIQTIIFLSTHTDVLGKLTYLAKEFNVTKATMSDAVRVLEEKKLVKKKIDPEDSRSQTISLTEAGQNLALKTGYFASPLVEQVEKLDQKSKGVLLSSMLKMIHELQLSGIINIQRMCLLCHFFDESSGDKHYCRLLKKPLLPTDLRIDCPEFEAKS